MSASLKARRLLATAAVHVDGTAAVYQVDGDHDRYRVVVGDGFVLCSCPSPRELCSHAEAAALLHEALVLA